VTDRRTEFSSLYRVCITCNAVKIWVVGSSGRAKSRVHSDGQREPKLYTGPAYTTLKVCLNYVSYVLFEIVGIIWRLSLYLLAHVGCVFYVDGFGEMLKVLLWPGLLQRSPDQGCRCGL